MCVLQDFESISPNLMARTFETVDGGGIIVILINNATLQNQIQAINKDSFTRSQSTEQLWTSGLFNLRLFLSLSSNPHCIMVDDKLNILPISTSVRNIEPIAPNYHKPSLAHLELKQLYQSLIKSHPARPLVEICKTLDQAKIVLSLLDVVSERSLKSKVVLTAARSRGKSSSLGLVIAGALSIGYSNIFVSSPSPENLHTLFEFVFKGLKTLDYYKHLDYEIVERSNKDCSGNHIVQITLFRNHKQTVQYLLPHHYAKLTQVQLLVIDEAAAIPISILKRMLGPYIVILCSTINGYEGTGRTLPLKLIQKLREQQTVSTLPMSRPLKEVKMFEPIRYASGDKIETWIRDLLCLDSDDYLTHVPHYMPKIQECELYQIQRKMLFSYYRESETLLKIIMSLNMNSSHMNTPNDILLMSDADENYLFALIGPTNLEVTNTLPNVLCFAQLALENTTPRKTKIETSFPNILSGSDSISWMLEKQFQDSSFLKVTGARIVSISVHPDLCRAGYGTRTVELLAKHYSKLQKNFNNKHNILELRKNDDSIKITDIAKRIVKHDKLSIAKLTTLLCNVIDRPSTNLQFLGVSFELTQELFNFWHRNKFQPIYLRQTINEFTGSQKIIMMRIIEDSKNTNWLEPYEHDFKTRFITLLAGPFRFLTPSLALSVLDPKLQYETKYFNSHTKTREYTHEFGLEKISSRDFKRLKSFSDNTSEYKLIADLVPQLAREYFSSGNRRSQTNLNYVQSAVLLCIGLQHHEVLSVEKAFNIYASQVLRQLNQTMKKLIPYLSVNTRPIT
jgi:N-acetyltransferase 10